MVIDKKLNLDKELEYFDDGSLAFAQNVVVSNDGLTIQNEPAIVNFVEQANFTLVGFIACNDEFVLFGKETDEENNILDSIYRIKKDGNKTKCYTNWKHAGGEVFGTFTYNVNNELIIAISERNLPEGVDCPLKIINLNRDKYIEGVGDEIYTISPRIPQSNIINVNYITGNRIKKGKYNFFIKYLIDDRFETSWFPIGIPVFAYDNSKSDKAKTINYNEVYAQKVEGDRVIDPKDYIINYSDFYNEDADYTNNNIRLQFEINDVSVYTHYKIGCLISYNGGVEAKETNKNSIDNKVVIINNNLDTISVDDLTATTFNLYNVNTMCNYKDRLYLANYKEENVNIIIDKIDTSQIEIFYDENDISNNYVNYEKASEEYKDNTLKNQWKPVPGRGAVYNFFIHYVYPNGNYTDGIPITNISNYKEQVNYGTYEVLDPLSRLPIQPLYYWATADTTTDDIYAAIQQSKIDYGDTTKYDLVILTGFEEFLNNNKGAKWFDVSINWKEQNNNSRSVLSDSSISLVSLKNYINSKGDVLYETPTNKRFDASKLYFTGIKMYPEFVGYFISYESPEYIQIGEGLITLDKGHSETNPNISGDLNTLFVDKEHNLFRFYYPEFNIVGGATNVDKLIHIAKSDDVVNTSRTEEYTIQGLDETLAGAIRYYKGVIFQNNYLVTPYNTINVNDTKVIAPDSFENLGKEGYLQLYTDIINFSSENNIYLAVSNNKDLYLSKTKKLVSLGYTKFVNYENDEKTYTYGEENVIYNYDFYNCFSSIFYFPYFGIIIDEANSNPLVGNPNIYSKGIISTIIGPEYYPDKSIIETDANFTDKYRLTYPHIGMIQYWHQSHYPLFLKELNNEPRTIFYNKNILSRYFPDGGDSYLKIQNTASIANKVIETKYVNDIYKLNQSYYDYTGKVLLNYDDTLYSNFINQYNKTIRRSDVLQSESVKTAWRFFRPENYKIITEDKGSITNIVGIGNYLFAHCEHSLFLFDITDSLQALDKNVQLLQPDSFEVAYKEVFTADKGYGGLQDFVSWICDEFGYIFYDRSAKKIYRFDGGQLKDTTEGIQNFINYFNPKEIWFGNDRPRNRILLNFRSDDDSVIFSYNLIGGDWISTHSYISNYKFIGLKDKLFIPNLDNNLVNITEYSNDKFNQISLPVGNISNDDSIKSFVDVVFTKPNYNKIKVLDFITYILNKEPNDVFELLQLEIYTNCCYSGIIDISQERKKISEYNKPYYDFERWNFNWFRNKIDKIENGDIVHRLTGFNQNLPEKIQRGYDNALISGKYVVIRFIFKNTTKQVNIKDIHAYFKP